MEITDDVRGIGQMVSWEPLIIGVRPPLELYEVVQASIPVLRVYD